jgi:hypothetical protein
MQRWRKKGVPFQCGTCCVWNALFLIIADEKPACNSQKCVLGELGGGAEVKMYLEEIKGIQQTQQRRRLDFLLSTVDWKTFLSDSENSREGRPG